LARDGVPASGLSIWVVRGGKASEMDRFLEIREGGKRGGVGLSERGRGSGGGQEGVRRGDLIWCGDVEVAGLAVGERERDRERER
jgi:hypothetical protein